jgi:beta-N-acetylhexosaminidase
VKFRAAALALVAAASLAGRGRLAALDSRPIDFNSPGTPETLADALLERMTGEEVLAQTFMLGWVGADPSPLIMEWIAKRRIGGVKIFGWNTEDTERLVKAVGSLQRTALASPLAVPLLVATDQEGGWIRHVKGATSETPGNMAIGASGFPRDAYLSGFYIGREIAALGVNMNFAPTVDLYTNPDSILIGPRAFGRDPVKTAVLGAAFAKGLAAAGVIATAKHYPGHGDTSLDSHGVLPQIDATFDVLWERELVPYRMLAKEKIPAIMSGHLAFPRTPAGYEPASLSRWFLTELLRGKIGYEGLIITDDLLMNGASASAGSLSRAARRALEAGNDVIMLSKTPTLDDPVWTNLMEAYRREPKFRSRVRDAARRVLSLKIASLRGENVPPFVPDPKDVAKRVPDVEGEAFFLDLAVRSVTLIEGEERKSDARTADVFPLLNEKAGVVLLAGQFEEFFVAGRAAYPGAAQFRFSYAPSDRASAAEKAALLRNAREADTIIFCLANPASLELLQALRPLGKRVIAFSVLSPVYLDRVPWVNGAVAVYSYSPPSFIAGFSALSGRTEAQGELPFPLSVKRRSSPRGAAKQGGAALQE